MTIMVVEDAVIRSEGDFETHQVRYSNNERNIYTLNTRTGSVLKEGWYDWPSLLHHSQLEMTLQPGGRRLSGDAKIYTFADEAWARRLGVPYDPHEDTGFGDNFRSEHGLCRMLAELDLAWAELTEAEIEAVIEEFRGLLNHAPAWGANGFEKKYDHIFLFKPASADGRADATFLMKKGEVSYGRI